MHTKVAKCIYGYIFADTYYKNYSGYRDIEKRTKFYKATR